jgi:hypothetical protein
MSDVMLQYAFKVTAVTPTPAADVSMLKNVLLVVKPANAAPATIVEINTASELSAVTANVEGLQLLAGGMSKFYCLPTADLDIATQINAALGDFYTIIVSSDFADEEVAEDTVGVAAFKKIQDILFTAKAKGIAGNAIRIIYADTKADGSAAVSDVTGSVITIDIQSGVTTAATIAAAVTASGGTADDAAALVTTAVDVGDETDPQTAHSTLLTGGVDADGADYGLFDGVKAHASDDQSWCETWETDSMNIGFFTKAANGGKNMCYAFGKVLSAATWKNQQFIEMPFSDDVVTLGQADSLFEGHTSFVLTSEEYGNRLAFFGNARAIVAPYVLKEIEILTQGKAVTYISANQPNYSIKEAVLLEGALNTVITPYITADIITSGKTTITLVEDNFVANGEIVLAEPRALWRVVASLVSE